MKHINRWTLAKKGESRNLANQRYISKSAFDFVRKSKTKPNPLLLEVLKKIVKGV